MHGQAGPKQPTHCPAAMTRNAHRNAMAAWLTLRHATVAAVALLLAIGGPAWASEAAPDTRTRDALLLAQAPDTDPLLTAQAQRLAGWSPPAFSMAPSPTSPVQILSAPSPRPTLSAREELAGTTLASSAPAVPARTDNLSPPASPHLQLAQAEPPRRPILRPMAPATLAPAPLVAPTLPPARPVPERQSITLPAGTGRIVQLPSAAVSVIAAEPRIARVEPTSQTTLFVMGVSGGRTTVVATAENGSAIAEYDVTVIPTATADQLNARPPMPSAIGMQAAIRQSVSGAQGVSVATVGRNGFVLNGTISNASDSQRAETIARIFAGLEFNVLNNLQLLSAIQVNVRVRIAEVSRQVTRELGLNWRAFGQTGNFLMGLRSGPAALTVAGAVATAAGSIVGSPARVGLGYSSGNFDINAVVDALAADNLISILAEPNLTAQSGETASFLAGGEFPIPVGAGQNGQITIEFKQFGVSLAFVPTVLATDRVNLRIRPEVSELSETGAVSVPLGNGGTVTIPALTVRRAETTVELGSGQSFAIAGLLQRSSRQFGSGIAGIGEIPVLGALFRSNRFQRNESELIIIVTPYLVRPVSDPGQLAAPTDGFRPATDIDRVLFQRQIVRGGPATTQIRSRPDAGFILE